MQIQSVPLALYSLQPLQTRALHALQKAPRFMILPSSARHRPHALDGSADHRDSAGGAAADGAADGAVVVVVPTLMAPFFLSMASSDFRRLQSKGKNKEN